MNELQTFESIFEEWNSNLFTAASLVKKGSIYEKNSVWKNVNYFMSNESTRVQTLLNENNQSPIGIGVALSAMERSTSFQNAEHSKPPSVKHSNRSCTRRRRIFKSVQHFFHFKYAYMIWFLYTTNCFFTDFIYHNRLSRFENIL